jgi:hypothetical protein
MSAPFKLAKALRFLCDLWLGCGLAGLAFYAFRMIWLIVSPATVFGGKGKIASGAIWIGVKLPVTMDSGSTGNIYSASLSKAAGELQFLTSDGRIQAMTYLDGVILTMLIVGLLYVTRQFLADMIAGTPFTPENARRLMWAGWFLLAIQVAKPLAENLAARWILSIVRIQSPNLSPPLDFDSAGILVALFILILSAIFRHGVELEKERSLTV